MFGHILGLYPPSFWVKFEVLSCLLWKLSNVRLFSPCHSPLTLRFVFCQPSRWLSPSWMGGQLRKWRVENHPVYGGVLWISMVSWKILYPQSSSIDGFSLVNPSYWSTPFQETPKWRPGPPRFQEFRGMMWVSLEMGQWALPGLPWGTMRNLFGENDDEPLSRFKAFWIHWSDSSLVSLCPSLLSGFDALVT